MSRTTTQHIPAMQLAIGDIVRRGTGELVTVVNLDRLYHVAVEYETARGTRYTVDYPPNAPVMVVAR